MNAISRPSASFTFKDSVAARVAHVKVRGLSYLVYLVDCRPNGKVFDVFCCFYHG
jgi:hypothetical protein